MQKKIGDGICLLKIYGQYWEIFGLDLLSNVQTLDFVNIDKLVFGNVGLVVTKDFT
jgi:hypothetical protein